MAKGSDIRRSIRAELNVTPEHWSSWSGPRIGKAIALAIESHETAEVHASKQTLVVHIQPDGDATVGFLDGVAKDLRRQIEAIPPDSAEVPAAVAPA